LLGSIITSACTSNSPPAEVPPQAPAEAPAASEPVATEAIDDGLGGRLFDRFYEGKNFSPDDKKTPGVADGKGGPLSNGTLPLVDGTPLLNDGGHDYRLKNFFGWDLRGSDGTYGPRYQNKSYVVPVNLLDPARSPEAIAALLSKGEGKLPAYAGVLSPEEVDEIVQFVVGIREGRLPGPDQVWTLSEGTPGNYRLKSGADPERGKKIFAERCSKCHGSDATELLFDDGEFSLGSHSRQKAYEDWFKILNGQPGTTMKRFVTGSGAEMGQQILDILAALCDTKAFPLGKATGSDVAPGDPRCGDYLK
jgi:mono/diheme cytochrome c family protein